MNFDFFSVYSPVEDSSSAFMPLIITKIITSLNTCYDSALNATYDLPYNAIFVNIVSDD